MGFFDSFDKKEGKNTSGNSPGPMPPASNPPPPPPGMPPLDMPGTPTPSPAAPTAPGMPPANTPANAVAPQGTTTPSMMPPNPFPPLPGQQPMPAAPAVPPLNPQQSTPNPVSMTPGSAPPAPPSISKQEALDLPKPPLPPSQIRAAHQQIYQPGQQPPTTSSPASSSVPSGPLSDAEFMPPSMTSQGQAAPGLTPPQAPTSPSMPTAPAFPQAESGAAPQEPKKPELPSIPSGADIDLKDDDRVIEVPKYESGIDDSVMPDFGNTPSVPVTKDFGKPKSNLPKDPFENKQHPAGYVPHALPKLPKKGHVHNKTHHLKDHNEDLPRIVDEAQTKHLENIPVFYNIEPDIEELPQLETLPVLDVDEEKLKQFRVDYRDLHTPLFIRTDNYSEVLTNLDTMKGHVQNSYEVIDSLENLKRNADNEHKKFKTNLEDIQRKLIYVDKMLFGN